MDDFNAELLKSWEENAQDMADTHDRLKGATVEYHEGKRVECTCDPLTFDGYHKVDCPVLAQEIDVKAEQQVDDRYILHGVLSRLMSAFKYPYKTAYEAEAAFYVVTKELINTLTSYLSAN